ncbi:P-loop containing nucleoside triphosphate hydrolase protein [Lactarius quietus]|nr:P-loop containing nucleoside triphosphate hydrolase protein [Lactarius quietus]
MTSESSESGTDFDSTAEMSFSPGNDHADGPLGISAQNATERRRMLDSVNRLRATGAQLDLDIPIIAVVGSQSAGKSSLIEAISGITLPRASGTCTRCPTECQLSRSSEPWRCVVSLRLVTDEDGNVLPQPRRLDFGDPIFDKTLVTDRIRRAQCAILNPGTSLDEFLEPSYDTDEGRQLSFSSNSICLEISSKDVDDLSFVDLPGLIVGGEPRESRLVQQLAEEYISKESCIILLTIACETDFENQSAHRLAAQFDPSGARTIGVLTKPDRIPAGDEASWVNRIQSGGKDGGIEYFSVKNPDSQDIRNGITYEQAREKETEFFETKAPWSTLEWLYKSRLGTDKLTMRLGKVLSSLIAKRLPELQDELDRLLEQTQQDISRLPSPPSSEPVAEILRLIGTFVRSIEQLVRGAPDENGLMQKLRGPQTEFKKAIRQTAPDFRPLERSKTSDITTPVPPPSFLSNEETDWEQEPSNTINPIFVDDVMKKANGAVTRELPNNFPYIIIKEFIGTFVKRWNNPSRQLFELTRKELLSRAKSLVEIHFSQYTHGHLKQGVMNIMQTHIQKCADSAAQHIDSLLEDESEPFTMNTHYYSEYRSKFLNHYKSDRLKSKSSFIKNLEDSNNTCMVDVVNETISSLAKLGLHSVEASSLAALLPPDPMEPAIEIMADVRAYFQVAYKRFVDNVPMSIDRALVRGLILGLETALFHGLSINGPEGYERCRRLLSEPEDIVERRSELEKRRQRLLSARKELVEAFL